MRLIGIILGTLLTVALFLAFVRFWGLSQQPDIFDHPWKQMKTPWIIAPWTMRDQAPAAALLWVEVKQTPEKGLESSGVELIDVLKQVQGRNLILEIASNVENIDLQISDLIGKSGEGRVLVQSEYDVILRAIKKLQPLWLYGSSQADRVRFRTFESMLILAATPFKGDVYIGPLRHKNIELLTPAVAQELHRRGKKVIAGPLRSKEEIDLALGLGVDGVFIDRPELLQLPWPL